MEIIKLLKNFSNILSKILKDNTLIYHRSYKRLSQMIQSVIDFSNIPSLKQSLI